MILPPPPPPQTIEQIAPALPARQASGARQVDAPVKPSATVSQLPPEAKVVRQPLPQPSPPTIDQAERDRTVAAVLEPSTDPSLPATRELGPETIDAIGREVLSGRPPAPR